MKSGANILITAVLVLGILAVLNFFSSRHYVRHDMTENQDYTLSAPTRKILERIDDTVTIKVYLTAKPPTEALGLKRKIEDLVSEFRAAGKGKIRIDFIDPGEDEAEREQAEKWGIRHVTLDVRKEDRMERVKTYFGMAILYEDKREVLPAILSTANLEYDLISSIKKIMAYAGDTLPQVAFLGGHGEPSIQFGEYATITERLKRVVHVTTVNPSLPKDKEISNEENAVLIVAAPKELTDRDLYAIDQFFMKGGSLVFLMDPIQVDSSRGAPRAEEVESNLDEMLTHYGVRVNHDLILEDFRFCGSIQRQRGQIRFPFPYPFLVQPAGSLLSRASPVTASIDRMILPWASSLTPLEEEDLQDREVIELAWTSPFAWTQEGDFDLQPYEPNQHPQPSKEKRAKRLVALAIQGKFTSFFHGKEIPPAPSTGARENDPVDPLKERIDQVESGQIVVVGDADFLKTQSVGLQGNSGFLLNTIEWLALNPELVTIRSKGGVFRRLDPELSKEKKSWKKAYKFFNLLGIPLAVALLGLARYLLRRGSRRRYLRKLAVGVGGPPRSKPPPEKQR